MADRLQGTTIAILATEGVEQIELIERREAVEADVLKGRTLTSWPSLQTDLRKAGATWVDEEVHVDTAPPTLVSSRNPDDLPAFCAKIVEEFCEGRHAKAPEPAGTGASTAS